jgi:predicted RNA-binding Zn-ribbon protein involved in translation (DUF1610 family)
MLSKVGNKLRDVRHGLTRLDSKPIGKAVLTVVLFLDLFILISIFEGLADHTNQLAKPGDFIPQHCREVVIDDDWNETNRLTRIAGIASVFRGSYVRIDNKDPINQEHPICQPISKLIRQIEANRSLTSELSDFLHLRTESDQVKLELERIQGAYNTSLLEEIAGRKGVDGNTDSLSDRTSRTSNKLGSLVQSEDVAAFSLTQNPLLIKFFGVIEASSEADRDSLLEELRHRNFWYPVKLLGMEMMFLFPLVLIFYLWNARSISTARPFQSLVSSHLLVVVFVPVVFKTLELIYDIVPKKLLKHVIELLESMKLVAIWHYFFMGLGILGALLLIYIMQKKLFSQDKLMAKRISKGLCQDCGTRLAPDSQACPLCGFKQFRECTHCNKATFVYGEYCKECGYSD